MWIEAADIYAFAEIHNVILINACRMTVYSYERQIISLHQEEAMRIGDGIYHVIVSGIVF